MKNKTTKFIFKTFILLPIGFVIGIFVIGIENFDWFISFFTGLTLAFSVVFWNLFDYEKYNEIEVSDFLESSHQLKIEDTDENWKRIIELTEQSIIKLKVLEKTGVKLSIEIPRKFSNSILTAERSKNGINLRIEKKGILKFIPDYAVNYWTLKKFSKELKTTTKTVCS